MSVDAFNGNLSHLVVTSIEEFEKAKLILQDSSSHKVLLINEVESPRETGSLNVIEYTEKIKPNGVSYSCYPGTEEKMLDEERSALSASKVNLAECCFIMSIIADRLPYINTPNSQCKGRVSQWKYYLYQISQDLRQISGWCSSFRAVAVFGASSYQYSKEIRDMLREPKDEEFFRVHNFQEKKESVSTETKELFAYSRRDLSEIASTLHNAKRMILSIKQYNMVSHQSFSEMGRLTNRLRKYVSYLTMFFCRPQEIEKKRRKYAQFGHDRTRQGIIQEYKRNLCQCLVDRPLVVQTEYEPHGVFLDCKELTSKKIPAGFIPYMDMFYEYEFIDPDKPTSYAVCRRRVPARAVQFLEKERELDKYMILALCHNDGCYNLDHHILIPKSQKDSYGYCRGGPYCHHKRRCPIPGIYRAP